MYTVLMIFGGIVGLIVTGAAFYTVWSVMEIRKKAHTDKLRESMRSWTAMDYGAIGVFVIGLMLLLADLFAVMRDRDSYPYYHYGYLLCAIIFVLIGMMFMVVRLGVIVQSSPKAESTFSDNDDEPSQTDESNDRV